MSFFLKFTFVAHQVEDSLDFFVAILAADLAGIPRFWITLLGVLIRLELFQTIH